jgi:hypothetical protein
MTAKTLIDFRVRALKRLQNGNRWQGFRPQGITGSRLPLPQKRRRTPQTKKIVGGTANRAESRNHLDKPEDGMNHELD